MLSNRTTSNNILLNLKLTIMKRKKINLLIVLMLMGCTLMAQYPSSSYIVEGTVLKKWTGSEDVIDMNSDPTLASVTSIGMTAFHKNETLKAITIGANVKTIGSSAFNNCSALKSVILPANLSSEGVGVTVFGNCSQLTSVEVCASNTSLKSVDNVIFTSDGSCLLCYPGGLTTDVYNVPEGVKIISGGAFCGANKLSEINFPATLTTVQQNFTFLGCAKLVKFSVNPDNKQFAVVDGVLFSNDKTELVAFPLGSKIKDYIIPTGVKTIKTDAFRFSRIKSVEIPNTVAKIENNAFTSMGRLIEIRTNATQIPSLGTNVFLATPVAQATLYTPKSVLNQYKITPQWNAFGFFVEIQ